MWRKSLCGVSAAALSLAVGFSDAKANGAVVQSSQKASVSNETAMRCVDDGFFKVAGSNTCLKIGGFAKYMAGIKEKTFRKAYDGDGTAEQPIQSSVGLGQLVKPSEAISEKAGVWQAAVGRLTFDAVVDADPGKIRGYLEIQAKSAGEDAELKMRHAYVQFDRFLLGRTTSSWAHADSVVGSLAPNIDLIANSLPRVLQIRYTYPFAAGISTSIALEDRQMYSKKDDYNAAGDGLYPEQRDHYGIPAVVVALKRSGSWGSSQLSAVALAEDINWQEKAAAVVLKEHRVPLYKWGVLAGMKVNVLDGKDALGGRVIYTSGFHPMVSNSLLDGEWSTAFWDDPMTSDKADKLDTTAALIWYRHAWTERYNTVFGLGYTSLKVAGSESSKLGIESAKSAKVAFLNNNYNITKTLKTSFDILYAKKKWFNDDTRDGLAATVQLTRVF